MDWTSQCAGRSEEQEHNEENLRTEMQFGFKQAIRKYRKGTFGVSSQRQGKYFRKHCQHVLCIALRSVITSAIE